MNSSVLKQFLAQYFQVNKNSLLRHNVFFFNSDGRLDIPAGRRAKEVLGAIETL